MVKWEPSKVCSRLQVNHDGMSGLYLLGLSNQRKSLIGVSVTFPFATP